MTVLEKTFTDFYEAVFDTNRERALKVVEWAVEKGISPEEIVFSVVVPSIERMLSDLVETHGATLSQHYICSKVAEEVTDWMVPLFTGSQERKGTIVIGTSRGDFHGLGKKIVAGCLKANMYEVHDLGINVCAEKFIEEALRLDADVIGVSSMMVHTAIGDEGALKVAALLDEKGLRGSISLIVGGAPYRFDHELYRQVNADGWSENAVEAVSVVDELIGSRS